MQSPLYSREDGSIEAGLVAEVWGDSIQTYASNNPAFGVRTVLRPSQFSGESLTGTTAVTGEGGWSAQDAVTPGGTYSVTDAAQPKGQLLVATTGATADLGVELGGSRLAHCLPTHATAPSKKFNFQAFIDPVAVDGQVLALMTSAGVTTPVLGASDAIADHGFIGFQIDEDGDLNFVTSSATGGTTDSVEILENAAFVQLDPHILAFSVDQNSKLTISVDNTLYASKASQISKASLPVGTLRPALGCSTSATNAPSMRVGDADVFSEYAG